MLSSMILNILSPLQQTTRLTCTRRLWKSALFELKSRGQGRRESGGFFLGNVEKGLRKAKLFLPYDEIDPNCLQGGIEFDGSKMDKVWSLCEARRMQVVADVHTHPGSWFGQSATDKANPMIPEKGHIALIVPHFAERVFKPHEIGLHEFLGRAGWFDHSLEGSRYFTLTWWSVQ